MRIGFNPNKDKKIETSEYFHQVIIPVYIPNEDGYFKDSFQILKYCLESLFKTSHANTYFTIVNNGSCEKVVDFLNDLYQKRVIHELIHTTNIGKLNAILKGLTGHFFELITITDADVLFLNGWQKATYKVYDAFPKVGAVSPVPNSKLCKYLTENVIFDNLLNKKVQIKKTKNPEAMLKFAKSIGNPNLYNNTNLNKCLVIENNDITALVGAGHFVATYRGDIFNSFKNRYTNHLMGSGEGFFIDNPVVENGFWRLSTYDNYAYHLGNTLEIWMQEKFKELNNEECSFSIKKLNYFPNNFKFIKHYFFKKLIFNKMIWVFYLRSKGLKKDEALDF